MSFSQALGDLGRRPILLFLLTLTFLGGTVRADEAETEGETTEAEVSVPPIPHKTFVETVNVSASRGPRALKDTAGSVEVIEAREIEELGMTDIQDLVKYQPGVYVDGDLSRLGLSGFNIRGIGGNRVLTQIDGIRTAEEFDFGPFSVQQYALDVDVLESAEIVRSAGSSLYGSDALGGVVSLVTRDPQSYLSLTDGSPYVGFKVGYDGRDNELSEGLTLAAGGDRWQGSIVLMRRDGDELDNQGTEAGVDNARTEPNPIDRASTNVLIKLVYVGSHRSTLELAAEGLDSDTETQVLTAQGPTPFGTVVDRLDSDDRQDRLRLSLEQNFQARSVIFDSLFWRVYRQTNDTEQHTVETLLGSVGASSRNGLLAFEEDTLAGEAQFQTGLVAPGGSEHLLTYGIAFNQDDFDQLRDRIERLIATGEEVPSALIFPTKYFPESTVREVGVYVQDEIELAAGRLRLIPGLRYDSYDLDADENDPIYRAGNPGTELPVDLSEEAVSPKLGVVFRASDQISLVAQYARGFRAPPFSAVNNGFTNFAGGYRTLPNADLQPETSDNYEVGLRGSYRRGSFSLMVFDNHYDDFIETIVLPFDPLVGLLEFQPQNVSAASISGVELGGDFLLDAQWSMRGSFAYIDGDNDTTGEPLVSIAPAKLVLGVRYRASDGRWGGELTTIVADEKRASSLPAQSPQLRTPSYQVVDLSAFYDFANGLSIQASVRNLFDETYWDWAYAQGVSAAAANLDFYTSPGTSFGTVLRYRF